MKYIIVSSNAVGDVDGFVTMVNEKIEEGYEPIGGVGTSYSGRLMQSMVIKKGLVKQVGSELIGDEFKAVGDAPTEEELDLAKSGIVNVSE